MRYKLLDQKHEKLEKFKETIAINEVGGAA